MHTIPTDEARLQLLNQLQPGQSWQSCAEKRQCIMCERTFRGWDVMVRRRRSGRLQLACPTCDSGPQFWVRLGNPLLDDRVWKPSEVASGSSTDNTAGEDDVASTG
jgi:hypothetical protein